MNSKLATLNRKQLEVLIYILNQEIVKLENKLESLLSSSILITDIQEENADCQDKNGEKRVPAQLGADCRTCQKFLQSVTSVGQLEIGKSGDNKRQQKSTKGELFEVSDKYFNSDYKVACEGHQNSCKHTNIDLQLSYHKTGSLCKGMEDLPLMNSDHRNENPITAVSDKEFSESLLTSSVKTFSKGTEERNITTIISDKKPQFSHASCSTKKKTQQKEETVAMKHPHAVTTMDINMNNLQSSGTHENLYLQKGSLQENASIVQSRCLSISAQRTKVQHFGKNTKYKLSKHSSSNNILKIPFKRNHNREIEMFSCRFCKVQFKSKQTLNHHMKTEHKSAQYTCLFCNKSFTYKHNLKIHQKNSHNRTTVLCSYCGKLVLQTRLTTHMEKVHEKPMYTCHICQKGFLKRECLEGHINKHSNTKPYVCEYCGRKYAYSTSLSSHRKLCVRASLPAHLQSSRGLDSKKTLFVCEICGIQFEGISGLKDHIVAKHSNKFQHCDFCGKGFQWRPSYNRHVKMCKDKSDLERERCKHLLSQKPMSKKYVCVCGKQYPYRQSYRRHEKSCHQKDEIESLITSSANVQVPFSECIS